MDEPTSLDRFNVERLQVEIDRNVVETPKEKRIGKFNSRKKKPGGKSNEDLRIDPVRIKVIIRDP